MKKRADGRYVLKETIEINGLRKQYTFYGKSPSECRSKRDALIRSNSSESCTFKDAYDEYKKLEEVRINAAAYKTKCERINAFASIFPYKLTAITPKQIALVINDLASENPKTGKPTAKRTLTRYLAAVSNVFEYAAANRLSDYNPCKYVKIPTDAPQKERDALTPEEYKKIIRSNDEKFLAAKIMILCGLRRGELTALTFGDIDVKLKTVTVNKAWNYKTGKLGPPKSEAGNRTIPVPDMLLLPIIRAKLGHRDTDLVISSEGERFTETAWQNLREYISKASGVPFTWHQLRHTYATILYDSGTGVLEAQRFLGHSDVKITLGIYTHLSEQKTVVASSKINEFLA